LSGRRAYITVPGNCSTRPVGELLERAIGRTCNRLGDSRSRAPEVTSPNTPGGRCGGVVCAAAPGAWGFGGCLRRGGHLAGCGGNAGDKTPIIAAPVVGVIVILGYAYPSRGGKRGNVMPQLDKSSRARA
jgi:hypothetical protein